MVGLVEGVLADGNKSEGATVGNSELFTAVEFVGSLIERFFDDCTVETAELAPQVVPGFVEERYPSAV